MSAARQGTIARLASPSRTLGREDAFTILELATGTDRKSGAYSRGRKASEGLAMRRFMIALVASLVGLSSAPEPWAQTPPPVVVPQVQPRINEPGPQLSVPQSPAPTPAPVQQPPSTSTASPAVPTSRHRATKQRQVSPARSAERSARYSSRNGGYCSYERCIQHCWDTGQQAFVSARKVANSCPDLCKHRGCGDLDRVARGVWPQGW